LSHERVISHLHSCNKITYTIARAICWLGARQFSSFGYFTISRFISLRFNIQHTKFATRKMSVVGRIGGGGQSLEAHGKIKRQQRVRMFFLNFV